MLCNSPHEMSIHVGRCAFDIGPKVHALEFIRVTGGSIPAHSHSDKPLFLPTDPSSTPDPYDQLHLHPDDQSWHSDRGDEYVSPNVISGISITKAKYAKVRRHSYAKDTKWDGDLPGV